jgi:hypothetical protein
MHRRILRTRRVLLATAVTTLIAAPAAHAAPIGGGDRNPSNNASSGYSDETQIIGEIAQNQGGHAAGTGGFVTRQSNKSDSGGGAIYGCRSKTGTEACVAANNLNSGDAFRFEATPNSATIGQLRFGLDINKTVAKPPFVTNATGLVKNLNADQLDGKSAEDFVDKGSLMFAGVAADGTIGANRGIPAGGKAVVASNGGNQVFTVPFGGDVSKCVGTANPTAAGTDTDMPLVVAVGTNPSTITVTEQDAATPYPFALQVTC